MVDILTGVPSIVAALFIYALCIATLGFPRSGFAVALALVLLMLPVIVRATEEMLRIVPVDLREASYALGVPNWRTITKIVLPAGMSGIITGILLALARVMGETAPLLILVGYSQAMNFNIFGGFMGSLPGMMYDQTSAGAGTIPIPTNRLWGAALTLILLIAVINLVARVVSKFFAEPRSRRQEAPVAKRLDLKDVNIFYGAFQAVADVSLSVLPRSVTAFIGPSGCGKTTVLRTLNRMHEVIPGAGVQGTRAARRRRHLRLRYRPGRGAARDRNGVPTSKPVPYHVDS